MKELQHYDNAAKTFYGTQQIKNLPLNSWDHYADHFETVLKYAEDITVFKKLASDYKWDTSLQIEKELFQKKHIVVVTDSHLKIVHATHNMIGMNGYGSDEVIGQTPKMFQGKDTCVKTNKYIANAIKKKEPFEAVVLNYRKDGSAYKCWIKGQPIFNSKKEVVHFIAYEKEVA